MGDIMAKATKLPSGNWNVRALEYTDENGKKHFKSFTAPTKKEAEYLAADYYANKKAKAAAGIANITLSEAIRRYIDSMNNILSSPNKENRLYSGFLCFWLNHACFGRLEFCTKI